MKRRSLIVFFLVFGCACSDDTQTDIDTGLSDMVSDAMIDTTDTDMRSDLADMPQIDMPDAPDLPDSSDMADMPPTEGRKCASWQIDAIFPIAGHLTTEAGRGNSLAFDAAGAAHVAFSSNLGLYYGTNASGTWAFEQIPSPLSVTATGVAVGAQGRVDIVYYEGENFDVRQVTNVSGSWVTTVVADEGIVGEDLTLEKDAQGNLHIAYLDGTRGVLVYGVRRSGVWKLQDAATLPGRATPSILLNAGVPTISYSNYTKGLVLTTLSGGTWDETIVDPGFDMGGWSSTTQDRAGNLHISSHEFHVDASELRYSTNEGGSWVSVSLDDMDNSGWGTSLLERSGVLHLAHVASNASELRYAARDSTGWTTMRVAGSSSMVDTSMEFNTAGLATILFKSGNTELSLAVCEP